MAKKNTGGRRLKTVTGWPGKGGGEKKIWQPKKDRKRKADASLLHTTHTATLVMVCYPKDTDGDALQQLSLANRL